MDLGRRNKECLGELKQRVAEDDDVLEISLAFPHTSVSFS